MREEGKGERKKKVERKRKKREMKEGKEFGLEPGPP